MLDFEFGEALSGQRGLEWRLDKDTHMNSRMIAEVSNLVSFLLKRYL